MLVGGHQFMGRSFHSFLFKEEIEGGQSLSPRFSGNGLIRLPLENCCFAQHCLQVVGERALLA